MRSCAVGVTPSPFQIILSILVICFSTELLMLPNIEANPTGTVFVLAWSETLTWISYRAGL